LKVEEALESNFVWRKHAMEVQRVLGTQRLLELMNRVSGPKECGG